MLIYELIIYIYIYIIFSRTVLCLCQYAMVSIILSSRFIPLALRSMGPSPRGWRTSET